MEAPGAEIRERRSRIAAFPGYHSRQRLLDRQEIPPGQPLLQRLAQQIGRMQRGGGADFTAAGVEREPAPARLEDSVAAAEQRLRRWPAETDQHVRIDQLDLAQRERQADRQFLRRRRAVAGRPPGHDIGDIGIGAGEPDRRHDAIEELAGAAHERQPLDILVAAGRLAHEHHARLRIAVGKNQPRGGRSQGAAGEAVQDRSELVEGLGVFRLLARRHDGAVGRQRAGRRGHDRSRRPGAVQGRAARRLRRGRVIDRRLSDGGRWGELSRIGEAIDGGFAQHRIDTGLQIEG